MKKKSKYRLKMFCLLFIAIALVVAILLVERHDIWAMIRDLVSLAVVLFIFYISFSVEKDSKDSDDSVKNKHNYSAVIFIVLFAVALISIALYSFYKKSIIFLGIFTISGILIGLSVFVDFVDILVSLFNFFKNKK
ncbi:hypothetical protein OZX58_00295 [Lactobacillus sp. ESL0680]|uniref:hypothetical protein n=1 Tax=Lactobacillus sp. ESL0680 TaxID=2983210 RepID=UPI0023F756A5|nr:hypothetical protein [Lactobacillus sp. ESL0680]WEV38746.1 hypothetical protein OZX58_00295 [Lactobacillus sp. ESL0680]